MAWSVESSKNNEARKVVWELVPYMHGRVLDIGCGPYKAFPHFVGVDNGDHWGNNGAFVYVNDAQDLSLFSDESCDAVFSSHLLEHLHYRDVPKALEEWLRVVKLGGHVILYLPDEDEYPKCGTQYANADHKWDCSYDKVVKAMEQIDGWDLVDFQKRNGGDEYSLWFVFRKTKAGEAFSWKLPKSAKTVAIVRYGAQGDMIQMSSILPWLKEQGYHVTLYCQDGAGYEVIKHDPNVDRFIVQGRDEIPNPFLGEFFAYEKKKYTKWINLCGSVEGALLPGPNTTSFHWPNEMRSKHFDKNYLEWTHEIAGVPPPFRPKFYSTAKEREKAKWTAQKWGRRNVMWSLAGSSGHKVWPHVDAVIASILLTYQDTHVVLVGDDSCKLIEQGWGKWNEAKDDLEAVDQRMHLMAGKWSIRESMAFAEQADLIVGVETGLLNAAGSMEVPKIITLSHSSAEMLTKHWKNTIALSQPVGVGCNKQPCRQLHGSEGSDPWLDCPQHAETGTALCQYHIGADVLWRAVQSVLGVPVAIQRRAA
jgi:ADP-heptose:LPS heptosyltransferase/predicted SAM-dependent methyltransferase